MSRNELPEWLRATWALGLIDRPTDKVTTFCYTCGTETSDETDGRLCPACSFAAYVSDEL